MSIRRPIVAISCFARVRPTHTPNTLTAKMSSAIATKSMAAAYGYVHRDCITLTPSITANVAMKQQIYPSFDHNSASPMTTGKETALLVYEGYPSSCRERNEVLQSKKAELRAQVAAAALINLQSEVLLTGHQKLMMRCCANRIPELILQ
jgi:hypothetical protein